MVKRLLLTLDNDLYRKMGDVKKKLHYKSIQEYIYELIRKELFRKKAGGRPKKTDSEEAYLNKFSKPTKETHKIMRELRRQGLA